MVEEGALPDLFADPEEEAPEAAILEADTLLDEPTLGSATPGSKIRSESDLAAKDLLADRSTISKATEAGRNKFVFFKRKPLDQKPKLNLTLELTRTVN